MAKTDEEKRQKSAAKQRKWQADNPERYREILTRHKAKHPNAARDHKAKRRKDDPERAKDIDLQWRLANRDKVRWNRLKYLYNITQEQWNALFDEQGRRCAICGVSGIESRHWHTDHCHLTNKVRGILCHGCNTGIGGLRHNVDNLLSAVGYLSKAT